MKVLKVWAVGAALMMAAGAALAQGPGGFGRGFGGGFGMSGLLMIPEVQQEIKLDEAQKDLLMQLQQEMRERGRQQFQDFQNLSQEERGRRMAAFRTEQDKKIVEILEPNQVARLKQLDLQQQGLRALGREDVANNLKLTADQKTKVQEALRGEGEAMRAMFQNGGFNFREATPEQRQEFQKKMQDMRSGTDAKLNAVLTAPQKEQFKNMQGAPFKFPEFRPGGFGGGRGNRNQ
jgi:hypothetical protein